MKRLQPLPAGLAALALVLALGACRPTSESRTPGSTSTPTAPTATASSVGTTSNAGSQTAPRTDGMGSAAPTGTPK